MPLAEEQSVLVMGMLAIGRAVAVSMVTVRAVPTAPEDVPLLPEDAWLLARPGGGSLAFDTIMESPQSCCQSPAQR